MWASKIKALDKTIDTGKGNQISIWQDNQQITYQAVIELWQTESEFCEFFSTLLAEAPFDAYFWETPPVTLSSITQPFECVLIDSPQLAKRQPDLHAFAAHFQESQKYNQAIVTFESLGKDALLVAPCPQSDSATYPHLAAFLRWGPAAQRRQLWQQVGQLVAQKIGAHPLWLSTSGLGVAWLHVRLDSRPKYYCYRPYRR
ncbi:MAG: hypothetical protein AAF152_13785 [Cyanobacteria bacterium P01_A01_bin.114]